MRFVKDFETVRLDTMDFGDDAERPDLATEDAKVPTNALLNISFKSTKSHESWVESKLTLQGYCCLCIMNGFFLLVDGISLFVGSCIFRIFACNGQWAHMGLPFEREAFPCASKFGELAFPRIRCFSLPCVFAGHKHSMIWLS